MMRLKINGEIHEFPSQLTVKELLQRLNIVPERVAVEVNIEIVKKTDYDTYCLHEGDSLEIVNFVGGG